MVLETSRTFPAEIIEACRSLWKQRDRYCDFEEFEKRKNNILELLRYHGYGDYILRTNDPEGMLPGPVRNTLDDCEHWSPNSLMLIWELCNISLHANPQERRKLRKWYDSKRAEIQAHWLSVIEQVMLSKFGVSQFSAIIDIDVFGDFRQHP